MKTPGLQLISLALIVFQSSALAEDKPGPSFKTQAGPALTAGEFQPPTRSERLQLYLNDMLSVESVVRAGASAAIRQAQNSPKEWGGGGEAYGYRIGDAYAQQIIRRTLQYGVSAALHEDNRYYVSGETGVMRRVRYAVRSTFLARHDNGNRYLSVSRFGSAAGSSFLSRIWQPPSTGSAGDGAVSFGVSIGSDVGFNVVREFWPDLKRRLRRN